MAKTRIVPAEISATPALEAGQTARMVPAVEAGGVFSPDECRRIVGLRDELGFDQARIAPPDTGVALDHRQVVDRTIRATERTHIVAGPKTRWIFDRLGATVDAANEKAWQFRIALMEPLQMLGYPEGGHYDWHIDLGVRGITALRKVSATVLLSDPESYDGGDLQLRNGGRLIVPDHAQGKAILFPSWVPHRVTPVTRGNRHVLVMWTLGRRSLR